MCMDTTFDEQPEFFLYSPEGKDGARGLYLNGYVMESLTPGTIQGLSQAEKDFVAYYREEIAQGIVKISLRSKRILYNYEACEELMKTLGGTD